MRLGVNIDHIATIRQARKAREPEPVAAAVIAELAGAESITVHLRGDRRHIQDRDVEVLREVIATRLNIEMAATPEMIGIASRVRPWQVTLVPEKPDEVTTTGGLDVVQHIAAVAAAVERKLAGRGRLLIRYSGTEPLLRVMIEGEHQAQITAWAEEIAAAVRAEIGV